MVSLTNHSTEAIATLKSSLMAGGPKTAQTLFLFHFSLVSVLPSTLVSVWVLMRFLKITLWHLMGCYFLIIVNFLSHNLLTTLWVLRINSYVLSAMGFWDKIPIKMLLLPDSIKNCQEKNGGCFYAFGTSSQMNSNSYLTQPRTLKNFIDQPHTVERSWLQYTRSSGSTSQQGHLLTWATKVTWGCSFTSFHLSFHFLFF